ncbi:hypothetical protein SAMN05192565_107164 [Methylobacterium gossipiicola]|uniref:Uncharacterized protein n=2 Tax=Methylobacterium gossipiicola TaxID=582675 RepID=A0A1I2TS81_9HYPH|nr:hypothetical protein SAMN05192565_107164 [Methylobacterium gossipiicola]
MTDPNRARSYLASQMIGGLRAGHDQFMFDLATVEREIGTGDPSEVLAVLGSGWTFRPGTDDGEVVFQRSISAEEATARLEG